MTQPVLIASERGEVGLAAGMEVLLGRGGAGPGRAMDAVEAAIRIVESNEADHYVGVGGLPNLLGEVELDASIMDGRDRDAGLQRRIDRRDEITELIDKSRKRSARVVGRQFVQMHRNHAPRALHHHLH